MYRLFAAGTEGSAAAAGETVAAGQEASGADDGGEDSPPDGNALPLASPLLPPAGTRITLPAVEGEAMAAPAADVATPVVKPATPQVAVPTDPAPAQVVADGAADAAQQTAAAIPVPIPPKSAQPQPAAVQAQSAATDGVTQRGAADANTAGADTNAESSTSSLIARMTDSDAGIDDGLNDGLNEGLNEGEMRRLLASLSGSTGAQKSSTADSSSTAAPKAPGGNEAALTPQPPALPPAIAVAETPATAVDRMLRELKFDRTSEVTTQAPVTATHSVSIQPAATAATATDTPVFQLQTPLQNRAEWANSLGERITWMTSNNQQNASIRLNPAHLGPIEVQVSVNGDETTISITAHHAATRDALEAAAPRLREMLGAHGQNSVNVNIQHQSPGDRPAQQGQAPESWARYEGKEAESASFSTPVRTASSGSRALDAYA